MTDDRSPNYDVRLGRLEADLVRLRERADRAPEREARLAMARNPRLARTAAGGVSYPAAADTPDTYPIIFIDSTYTEAQGDQTPSDTDRQASPAAFAHYRSEEYRYIAEGTPVDVYRDNGRWWILGDPGQGKAEEIEFTLTANMAAQQATATVTDFYRGYDPGTPLTVYDPQDRFPRAPSGAKGKATYDDVDDQYHVIDCQQYATLLGCVTNGAVASTDATFAVTDVEVLSPIDELLPTVASVRNTFSDEINTAAPVVIGWNHTDQVWDVIEVKRKHARIWVKTQTAWETAGGGDPHDKVYVKRCNADGSGEAGAAFYVYLPDAAGRKPNVGEGEVLAAGLMNDGLYVCLSDYLDEDFGTIVWWSGSVASIREGWKLADGNNGTVDLSGRFIMCIDEGGLTDEDEVGDTGGHRYHGQSENNHSDHVAHEHPPSGMAKFADTVGHQSPAVGDGYGYVEDGQPGVQIADHYVQVTAGEAWLNNVGGTLASGDDQDSDDQGTTCREHIGGGHDAAQGDGEDPHAGDDNDTDNRPHFYVLAAKQRIDNST